MCHEFCVNALDGMLREAFGKMYLTEKLAGCAIRTTLATNHEGSLFYSVQSLKWPSVCVRVNQYGVEIDLKQSVRVS